MLLPACRRDSLDKGLLGEEEENDDREGKDRGRRHELGIKTAVVGNKLLQPIAKRVLGGVVYIESSPRKSFQQPMNWNRAQVAKAGLDSGMTSRRKVLPLAGAVDAGGFRHFSRNRPKELR